MTGATEDDAGFQEIWSLFQIDARSDAALAGLDMDQLRQRYNNGDGGRPMNKDHRSYRVFLVANATTTIECVDADYQAADHIPSNWRLGTQHCFGWMPMLASCVAELWVELVFFPLQRIAPATIRGSHLEVWDTMNLRLGTITKIARRGHDGLLACQDATFCTRQAGCSVALACRALVTCMQTSCASRDI